jgi:serine/threonine protein kinase
MKLRKTRKTRKPRKALKGGRFYGSGSYGHVMGDPRLLCPGEEMKDVEGKREISKIFDTYENYMSENNVMDRINEVLTPAQIDKLKEYIVLPIKGCRMDMTAIKAHDVYKSDDWFKNGRGVKPRDFSYNAARNSFTVRDTNDAVSDIYQIVYPIASHTLYEKIGSVSRSTQIVDVYKLLFELENLFKGLEYMQSLNLAHYDIKSENIMSVDGKMKFIDLERFSRITYQTHHLNHVKTIDNLQYLTDFPAYTIWTHDITLLYFIDRRLINTPAYRIKFSPEHPFNPSTYMIVKEMYEMAVLSYYEFDKIFKTLKDNKFKFPEHERIKLCNIVMQICVDRFYGMTGITTLDEVLTIDNFEPRLQFKAFTEYINHLTSIEYKKRYNYQYIPSQFMLRTEADHTKYIRRMQNAIPREMHLPVIPTDEHGVSLHLTYVPAIQDYVVKKNDIYSMGYVLLTLINHINIPVITPEFSEIMLKVFYFMTDCLHSVIPSDFKEYYHAEDKSIYFKNIFKRYPLLLNEIKPYISHETAVHIPLPASVPSTPSRGTPRSARGTPRRTPSRGTPRSARGTPRSARRTPRRTPT